MRRSGLRLTLGDGRRRLTKAWRCPGSRVAAMQERLSSCSGGRAGRPGPGRCSGPLGGGSRLLQHPLLRRLVPGRRWRSSRLHLGEALLGSGGPLSPDTVAVASVPTATSSLHNVKAGGDGRCRSV